MTKKIGILGMATCLGVLLLSARATAAETATDVLECMRANVPALLSVRDIELEAKDSSGTTRLLKGKLYVQRDTDGPQREVKAMLRILSPEYLAGASYLVRQRNDGSKEDVLVYLPSVRRVKRVSGDFADGPLLGTNISYLEFKQMQYAFEDARVELEGSGELATHPTYILKSTPPENSGSRYNRIRIWVDEKTCVPLKTEFLENDTVRKRLTTAPDAVRKTGDIWYASQVEMTDLVDNTRTEVRTLNVDSGKDVPSRVFNPGTFYR